MIQGRPASSAARRGAILVVEVLGSALAYSMLNALSARFQIAGGVSVLFPGTAVSILACMYCGWRGAVGVILGTVVTPWGSAGDLPHLFLSGVINAAEGLIPYFVFRHGARLSADLRDVRSLSAFLLFGVTLNTGFSALLGNLLLIAPAGSSPDWSSVAIWWVADFTAAMLLATPLLAFAPRSIARRLPRSSSAQPRSIANALQITALTLLLGWSASAILRNYLISHIESSRLAEQQRLAEASRISNEIHSNFLFASGLQLQPAAANWTASLESARENNERLLKKLEPYATASGSAPALGARFRELAELTRSWFRDATFQPGSSAVLPMHMLGRKVLALKSEIELQNLSAWEDFARNRRTIMAISLFTDLVVLLILLIASVQLIYGISRPLNRLHQAVDDVRHGAAFNPHAFESRYSELESLCSTLSQTLATLREREIELSTETARATEASRHKGEFLAKMSHELRTPLNSIVGFSDLLLTQDSELNGARRTVFVENVSRSARHLLALINDLLDLARLESGKIMVDVQQIDLRFVIENSAAIASPLLRDKQQHLLLEIPEQPLMVTADPLRLQQVLLNLLSNANKFSGPGTAITLSAHAVENGCRIAVRDEGIGIPPEAHERIFHEFEQLHARGEHSRGAGLGLALARRFVEAMNGRLTLHSEPSQGSTFEVQLPSVTRRSLEVVR